MFKIETLRNVVSYIYIIVIRFHVKYGKNQCPRHVQLKFKKNINNVNIVN